jgi:hypothetical protein
LNKTIAVCEAKIAPLTEKRAAIARAVAQLESKLRAEQDEAASLRVDRLQVELAPRLTRYNKIVQELAETSRELLDVCKNSDAYGDIGGLDGVGLLLFPPRDWRNPLDDYAVRCLRARLLQSAELATQN